MFKNTNSNEALLKYIVSLMLTLKGGKRKSKSDPLFQPMIVHTG